MSNTQYQSQNWAKVSQMALKINNQFKSCIQDHQYAIWKGSIKKTISKKMA